MSCFWKVLYTAGRTGDRFESFNIVCEYELKFLTNGAAASPLFACENQNYERGA
jgi:hypothetical protein